jgi:hypothetical protein
VGETRVDLLHLLEDLRDAYPGAAEETILTEVVANSLDSGATTVTITADPARSTLTIVDDGIGMRRRDLARYHDVAATTKVRGSGIGFAGVGIKIGLLVSEEVVTETRLGKHHLATVWRLTSRYRAPWKWLPPPGLVAEHGTAVQLQLKNPLSPLLDPGFIEVALWRHYQPLLDPAFADILVAHYPRGVHFVVNRRPLQHESWEAPERAPIAVRLARKRRPSASGYMTRDRLPLPEERRGLAISTFGKVIKRGWDWLAISPSSPERVGGLIEAPALAQVLTLNKADFIRAGTPGAIYLAYRKAIQEAVARQLAVWGDLREAGEHARRRATRPVERDLEAVLLDLADEFPLLATLVERRPGGQRALPIGRSSVEADKGEDLGALVARLAQPAQGAPARTEHPEEPGSPEPAAPERLPPAAANVELPATRGPRRPARYGLSIQFEQRPDDPELARLVETTVWVNEAHPAYRRAVASRSEGYHIAVASAMALAPLAVEPGKEHGFVTAFLASWGATIDRRKGRGWR